MELAELPSVLEQYVFQSRAPSKTRNDLEYERRISRWMSDIPQRGAENSLGVSMKCAAPVRSGLPEFRF